MTRILVATPSLRPEIGGPAYSVAKIHSGLADRGANTVAVTNPGQGGMTVPKTRYGTFFQKFDLVRNFGIWTAFNHKVSVASRKSRVPLVISPMGMLEPWALGQKKVKKFIGWNMYQRRDINRAAALHATAAMEVKSLKALGILCPIALIPHGIDIPSPEILDQESKDRSSGAVSLLFLSRIHPKKGLADLITACSKINKNSWNLTIAGPDLDGYRVALEEMVDSLGLRQNVQFVGPVYGEQKTALFRDADIFILPTYSENFGLVIAEALAHRLPVITTNGAPWSELTEFQCGWWLRPGAIPLQEALEEAMTLPRSVLVEMGRRGGRLVELRYSWPSVMDKHHLLHSWILGGGARPSFVFV